MAALITHSCINLGPLLADRQGKNPQELTNQLEDLRNSMQPAKEDIKNRILEIYGFFSIIQVGLKQFYQDLCLVSNTNVEVPNYEKNQLIIFLSFFLFFLGILPKIQVYNKSTKSSGVVARLRCHTLQHRFKLWHRFQSRSPFTHYQTLSFGRRPFCAFHSV